MLKYTHFEDLIFNYCCRHNLPMIQPDANLHYVIYVNDIEIRCFSKSSTIYLQSPLAATQGWSSDVVQSQMEMVNSSDLKNVFPNDIGLLDTNRGQSICQEIPISQCEMADFEASIKALASQVEVANRVGSVIESVQTSA